MVFAARGAAHVGGGVGEAEQAQDPQAVGRGQPVGRVQHVAFKRQQEVHRDRLGFEVGERERELDQFAGALAHAGDEARAGLQAGALGRQQRVHAVVVGVGGADVAVAGAAGVEVVVEPVQAGELEHLGFFVVQQAGRNADFEAGVFVFDRAHVAGELLGALLGGAAAAEDHAVAVGARVVGPAGFGQHFFFVFDRVGLDVRVAGFGLRAVGAVFGAAAVLGVVEDVNLHAAAEVVVTHAIRRVGQAVDVQRIVGQHAQGVVGAQRLVREGGVGEAGVEIAAGQGVRGGGGVGGGAGHRAKVPPAAEACVGGASDC